MRRRDFLKYSASLGILSSTSLFLPRSIATELQALPIPTPLFPDAQGKITLTMQQGKTSLIAGKESDTWGFNGAFLGPALFIQRGKRVQIEVENKLPEAVSVHWHGLEIPGRVDGGSEAEIPAGNKSKVSFTLDQPAATCWFHPHTHGRTGYQVAKGLAGLVIINDEESAALDLPHRWGIDDIPVILQDKRFNQEGQIDYELDLISATVGWFGDRIFTNGVEYPQHIAPRGWVRLRILNGCNARTLSLTTSDQRPMYVIASDGGLLSEPIKLTQLDILCGERFEMVINTTDGKPFDLLSLPTGQMAMVLPPFDQPLPVLRVATGMQTNQIKLPDQLCLFAPIPALTGLKEREIHLMMDPQLDQQGMQALMERYGHEAMGNMAMESMDEELAHHGHEKSAEPFDFHNANRINGVAYQMNRPMFDIPIGEYQRWIISGVGDMMMHPFHVHGTRFRILSENGLPPAPHRAGWKDTVHVENSKSEILVHFLHPAEANYPYMAHCHVLEHEDTGMMCSFTVRS